MLDVPTWSGHLPYDNGTSNAVHYIEIHQAVSFVLPKEARMRKFFKWLGIILGSLVGLILLSLSGTVQVVASPCSNASGRESL